jgi:threonine dehydratase
MPIHLVHEGLIAKTMLEPAGALGIAGLELQKDIIKGKTVICIISGSNNDISRLHEIRLRSAIYQCKEAYYLLSYPSISKESLMQSTSG